MRQRTCFSKKRELIKKSVESALAAIQIFNNPLITFKAESFIVLMVIAWTYLLHAYYTSIKVDIRYFKGQGKSKRYLKTKYGAFKHWELEKCLEERHCPLDQAVKDNLKFLIGIRHEIEHQMTSAIESSISAKFQACCINYNKALKSLFPKEHGLEEILPVALQLFSFAETQVNQLKLQNDLPQNLIDFVSSFEGNLDSEIIRSAQYSYKVIYTRDNVNHSNQADIAYRFVSEDSEEGKDIHKVLIKRIKHEKLTQKQVIEKVHNKGFKRFNSIAHQKFWKSKWSCVKDRNLKATQYGELVVNTQWLWYEKTWLPEVIRYCEVNRGRYV
jgi:hypothetical protein